MKTVIYIVRHVQAEGNLYRIFHGHTDGDVTQLGLLQAERLRDRFKDVPLAAVISSDLTRAKKTALAIGSVHPQVPVEFTPDLREISAGVWEGQNFEGLKDIYPDEYRRFQEGDMSARIGGGETIGEVAERMRKKADKLAVQYRGKAVAMISHGCAIRSLLSDYEGSAVIWGTNASVSKVIYEDGKKPVIEYMWDAEHLGELRSVKLP